MRILVLTLTIITLGGATSFADWPTYRADAARSGYVSGTVPAELHAVWTFRSENRPQRAWPMSRRMRFDQAFQPIVVDDLVIFGSSADGRILALEAATGKTAWTFYTQAPVRFAPAAWKDRLFIGGDDGFFYCLAITDGRLLWKNLGGPEEERLLGNDRMIARWPVRGGAVVEGDIVYFGAGIWPTEGIHLYALNASDGEIRWKNDESGSIEMPQPHPGADAASGISSQGYFALGEKHLFVPTGRAVPAVFDRTDGTFKCFQLQANGKRGGADVMALGDALVNANYVYDADTQTIRGAVGSPCAAHPEFLLSFSKGRLIAHDAASLWNAKEVPDRDGKATRRVVELTPPVWTIDAPIADVAEMIAVGDTLILGGKDQIAGVSLDSKETLWIQPVDGLAAGLAFAGGRLVVSTDKGAIHCFAAKDAPIAEARPADSPGRPDVESPLAEAAREVLGKTKVTCGYCLDIAAGEARLAEALVRQSDLYVIAVEKDAEAVAAARKRLDAAGLLGSRVAVIQADPATVKLPRYFADLVVSGRSASGEPVEAFRGTIDHVLRPCGGIFCLGTAGSVEITHRGPLEGAGSWTHQYCDTANTLCSTDTLAKAPLRMLWFRDVDFIMPNRHGRGPAPLVRDGRLFMQGINGVRAVNLYNGRPLWTVEFPGILAKYHQEHLTGVANTQSNFCLGDDCLYIHTGDVCTVLDLETGEKRAELAPPSRADGSGGTWGYLAYRDGILYGSLANTEHLMRYAFGQSDMDRLFTESDTFFAMDPKSGTVLWRYDAEDSIRHNAIAIGANLVYLIDRPIAPLDDYRVYPTRARQKVDPAKDEQGNPLPTRHEPGTLLALERKTGKTAWTAPEDVSGTVLALSEPHDTLLMAFQPTRFSLDSDAGNQMTAYRASTGDRLWNIEAAYRSRIVINDTTIYAEPGAWNLLNGEPRQFDLQRSYGCGTISSSPHLLLFRSATFSYCDLDGDGDLTNYGGIRPGCWINVIPAGGVVTMADAASWCSCSYLMQATIAMEPSE